MNAESKDILSPLMGEGRAMMDAVQRELPQIEKCITVAQRAISAGGKVVFAEEGKATESMLHNDIVIGISATGNDTDVNEVMKTARRRGIVTCCITLNASSAIILHSDYRIIPDISHVGGLYANLEKLTLGFIKGMIESALAAPMVHNGVSKLDSLDSALEKSINAIMAQTGIADYGRAKGLLLKYGSVSKVVKQIKELENV
ncbi:MAG: SIS domain-containing protein [Bacteroidales bacterium]|nr:SIS domain-containing protein [Bacteroidales bacterium]